MQPGSNTPATAEEAFKALYQGKKFMYGQQSQDTEIGQQSQDENDQQNQENVTPEVPVEETPDTSDEENGDYDVAVAEIVETDYGYFLRMDSGTWQFGYRWYRDTPNQRDRVDTWETDDLSTYSGTDSYVRVE